jgi:hypothetical protein
VIFVFEVYENGVTNISQSVGEGSQKYHKWLHFWSLYGNDGNNNEVHRKGTKSGQQTNMTIMSHGLICGGAGGVGYIAGDASYVTHLSAYFGLVCYAWSQRHKNHLCVFGSDLRAA